MYKTPKISDAKCIELSKETGLWVSNRTFRGIQYPVVKEGKRVIDTTFNYLDTDYTEIIKSFKGDLLILGMGMGRGIIEACSRAKVKKVTVIEIDQRIVDLFWLIYGHDFKGVNKLSIEVSDAKEYKKTNYDEVFIDIYHPPFNKKEYRNTMDVLRDRFKEITIHFIDLY